MPLSKQMVPVLFSGGLNTNPPKQLVVPGQFLVLENCIRRKNGRVDKRFGFESLGKAVLGTSDTITSGFNLSNFKEDLLLLNQENIYSYSPSNDKWVDKGKLSTARITESSVIRNSYIQAMPDMVSSGGQTLTVWEDSRGGIRCSVISNDTDSALLYDTVVSASGVRPKCIALGVHFLMIYIDGATLKCRRIAMADPTVLLTEQTLLGAGVANQPFDLTIMGINGLLAINTTTPNVRIAYITEQGQLGNPVINGLPLPYDSAFTSPQMISIIGNATLGHIHVLYEDTGATSVKVFSITSDFLVNSTTTIDAAQPLVSNGTLVVRYDNSIRGYYEIPDADPKQYYIKDFTFSWTGVGAITIIDAAASFELSVGLASKAFAVDQNEYVLTSYESPLQSTYFLIKQDSFIVSKILPGTGIGHTAGTNGSPKSGLPRVTFDSTSMYNFPAPVKNKLISVNGVITSVNIGVNQVAVDFSSVLYITDTLGDNMLISGGIVLNYDGVSITEHGFNVYPEDLITDVQADAATFPAVGDYVYTALYEWVDGKGQIHRSAPAITVTATIANTTDQVNITVPKLNLTQKEAPRAPVQIVIYRSDVDLSDVLYRLATISNDNVSQPFVAKTDFTIEFTDDNSMGADLTSQEILYTTGGILENIAPPACKVVHKHKNRIFVAGLEDDTLVEYSKEWVFGEGVAFSSDFQIRVDGQGGGVTALGTLDDKLIIFKRDRAFAVAGDGPLDTGAQNDYGIPQLISGDVGVPAEQAESVVITPQGLMFKSDKGIWLLTRGLEMNYLGAPVENFNNLTISSSIVLEDENEVRFTTLDGQTLVYNYFFNQWSVFTNYTARSAVLALNSYMHLKADGTVNAETQDKYNDNGSRIKMAIETSWLSFANIQGFQRIYWLSTLGDFLSHHFTKIQLAYDFENVYTETVYYNTQSGQMQTVYGTGDYGEETPYGGSGSSVYQWRLKPRTQRCQSIKVRLEDIDTVGSEGGASFNLIAISFVVGIMRGVMRQGESRTLGN